MLQWNPKQDRRLYKLDDLIDDKITLNKMAADYYSSRNEWVGYPSIIIGAVATSFIFTNSKEDYMTYINGGLTLIVTILAGFKQFYKFETKMNAHRNAIIQYKKLERDIKEQKDLDFADRKPVAEFMKQVKDTFNTLDDSTPMIPLNIEKEYYKHYDKYKKDRKMTGELSEEEEKFQKKMVKVLNESTGKHEEIEIVVVDEKDYLTKRLENEIDTMTENNKISL